MSIQSLSSDVLSIILSNLSDDPESLLRFGETSPYHYQIINSPHLLKKISQRCFNRMVDDLDDYRILAGRFSVTRDSPLIIGIDLSLERASQKHDLILINDFLGSRKTINLNRGLIGAAKGGHLDLVQFFISKNLVFDSDYELAVAATYERFSNQFSPVESITGPCCIDRHSIRGEYDDIEILKILSRDPIDSMEEDNYRAMIAAKHGDMTEIKRLTKNPNIVYDAIMIEAAIAGHFDIVKYIFYLKKSKNYSSSSSDDYESPENTATNVAASRGYINIVKFFIDHGVRDLYPALMLAVKGGHLEVVNILLNYMKNKSVINHGITFAAYNGYIELTALILQWSEEPSNKSNIDEYNTAIAYAARRGHFDIVKMIMDKGFGDPDLTMTEAAKGGYINIIHAMIDFGANLFDDAMINAAEYGYIKVVKLMIDRGAREYLKALYQAAKGGHLNIVKLLIKKGHLQPQEIIVSLNYAVEGGNMHIIVYIIQYISAKYNIKIIIDFKTLELAIKYGYVDMVKYILDIGVNLNMSKVIERFYSVFKGYIVPEMERLLLEKRLSQIPL